MVRSRCWHQYFIKSIGLFHWAARVENQCFRHSSISVLFVFWILVNSWDEKCYIHILYFNYLWGWVTFHISWPFTFFFCIDKPVYAFFKPIFSNWGICFFLIDFQELFMCYWYCFCLPFKLQMVFPLIIYVFILLMVVVLYREVKGRP